MRTSSLLFLEPPYQMVRRLPGSVPALGTVALFDTTSVRPSTNELKVQMEQAPWCPVCLLATPDSGVRSVRRLARTCVVFGLDEGDGASGILKAVAQRPRPTASDLAEWVTRRTRLPTLARVMADLFSRPAFKRNEAALLPYAVREQVRRLGDWSAQEWQVAGWLADLAADRSLLNRTMAASDDASVMMRRHMVDLLGMGESEFHDRYGWEWVLECALRRSGFFERSTTRNVRVLRGGWEGEVAPRATA
ncbi:MAG: hypothetical protein JNJ98_20330 [Gemmatimonadetes bacterium]|nr:hypothetical protein [Gemmatimonadota bacterium]